MSARRINGLLMAMIILFCAVSQLSADVVHESKTQMTLLGSLGTLSKILGLGKPIQTIDYYAGNKMRSDVLDDKGKVKTSEIIDLDKELFITLDHKKQKYTQVTFADWRQQLQDAMAKMEESKEEQGEESEQPQNEWAVTYDISRPEGTENVNGRVTAKVIVTVIAKEKPKTSGGTPAEDTAGAEMRMTSTSWICPRLEGSDEIDAFNQKLAKKLGFSFDEAQTRSMWEQIMQSYPQIKDISETAKEKGGGLEGTPVRTNVVYETIGKVKPTDEENQEEAPASIGGLIKGLGKKAVKKDEDQGPKPLIEMTSDILRQEVTPVDQAMFTVPEKYKLDK